MFLAFILVSFGICFFLFSLFLREKKKNDIAFKEQSEGEVLKNKYIIEHEQKLKDDADYDEYLEWCKFKGELPVDKIGYDEHRMKEYQIYKKLMKSGIGGL